MRKFELANLWGKLKRFKWTTLIAVFGAVTGGISFFSNFIPENNLEAIIIGREFRAESDTVRIRVGLVLVNHGNRSNFYLGSEVCIPGLDSIHPSREYAKILAPGAIDYVDLQFDGPPYSRLVSLEADFEAEHKVVGLPVFCRITGVDSKGVVSQKEIHLSRIRAVEGLFIQETQEQRSRITIIPGNEPDNRGWTEFTTRGPGQVFTPFDSSFEKSEFTPLTPAQIDSLNALSPTTKSP